MEILISGALVTLMLEGAKALKRKIHNQETAKAVILVSGFVLSFLAALFAHTAPRELVEHVAQVWVSAIGIYEVLIKRIIQPVLDKFVNS